jgi:hypothetical protein
MTPRPLAFLLAAGLLSASPARAQTGARPAPPPASTSADLARAEALYREALGYVGSGEHDRAVPLLEEGYRLSRLPGFLFNLGQAHRLRGRCTQAVLYYRAFLSANVPAAERAEAQGHVAALEPCPAPAPASPAVIPAPPPVEVVDARAPAPAASPAARPGRGLRLAGAAVMAGAAAAGATSLYFALRASEAEDKVNARYGEKDPRWTADLATVDADGQDARTRARVLAAVAGGLLATGATLYLLGWRESRPEATVALIPAPDSARVALHVDF